VIPLPQDKVCVPSSFDEIGKKLKKLIGRVKVEPESNHEVFVLMDSPATNGSAGELIMHELKKRLGGGKHQLQLRWYREALG
jgi:hypothetical protein